MVEGTDEVERRRSRGDGLAELLPGPPSSCSLARAASIPKLLADVVELRLRHESASQDEARALWLGAGLATHIGLAIFEERFVTVADPWPVPPAAIAA